MAQPTISSTAYECPAFVAEHYLTERYRGGTHTRSPLLRLYYAVKPGLPRAVQLTLRRAYAKRQARAEFPRWPVEPLLVEQQGSELQDQLRCSGATRLPLVNFWPDDKRFACVLTHDVEGPAGVENVRRVLDIEQRHGFVSSWNFVAEWYPIEDGLFEEIRARGGEVGLHGVKHDGRLFESRDRFEAELPKIHRYLREWGALGFRSPATHRNAEWMHELGCLYDSSFPDTDPFEPQPGGCCSIFPFMLGDLVELPITLVQDHTLFEILRARSIDHWIEKSNWIIEHHGLINLITHPDYLDTPERLDLYEQFLVFLEAQRDGWHVLPKDVARWWKKRERLRVSNVDGQTWIEGDSEGFEATVAWAYEQHGRVLVESCPAA